jgi:hypothetical protein
MILNEKWATPEDFATLFQYCWYRDFPIDQLSPGARRVDWTIHIGVVVRNVADLMGFVTRFESGGRKDAVLRSRDGDEFTIEWEWGGVWGNELGKLKSPRKNYKKEPKCAVFITYTHTPNMGKVYSHVSKNWEGAKWPLLLILIDVIDVPKSRLLAGAKFQNIQMSIFDSNGRRELRTTPAYPWKVSGTRWCTEQT